MTTQNRAAIIAVLLALPMYLLFLDGLTGTYLGALWLEPVLTDEHHIPTAFGRVYMLISLVALPIAFVMSLMPMLRKGKDGKRHVYLILLVIAALIAVPLFTLLYGFGEEIYRCNILGIPNCD